MLPWTDKTHEQAMAGAAKYLYGRKVPFGRIVRVRSAIAWDATSTIATAITIGIEERGKHSRIASWSGSTTAVQTRGTLRDFWLRAGQRLYVYFEDATNGDDLFLVGHGFEDTEGEQTYWPG